MTASHVQIYKDRPTLFVNNDPVAPVAAYATPAHLDTFLRAGIQLYTTPSRVQWWVGPETYDFDQLDTFITAYVDRIGDGYLMPRLDFARQGHPWWGEQHPSEMVVVRDIETGAVRDPAEADPEGAKHLHHAIHLEGRNLHSFHSVTWREEAGTAIAALVRHAESQPYADRILGWMLVDGWPQEWFHWSEYSLSGLADYSPAAEADFRRWVRATYGEDVAQLQAAWGRDVTFDEVQIPAPAKRERITHGEFYDPVRDRPTIDYVQCLNDAVADSIISVCKAAKAAMTEAKVVCTFYGYGFCHLPRPQLNGHNATAKVLASDAVDLLASPHSYDNRGEGGYHAPQAMADSIRLAGKMHFDEVDPKTMWTPEVLWKDNISQPTTVWSTVQVLKKDAARSLATGDGMWWTDLMDQGWFDHDACVDPIQRTREIARRLLETGSGSAAEIALVVGERAQVFQAPRDGLIDASREMFRNWYLSRIGAPFDTLLFSDLKRPTTPRYKLYIMADLGYLSQQDREFLDTEVKRDGATVLWVYAPGFLDERSASVANMAPVTGMSFGMRDIRDELDVVLTDFEHPITAGLPSGLTYGTGMDRERYLRPPKIQILPDTRVTPSFYLQDDSVEVLGVARSTGQPALGVKNLGSWRSIYSLAPMLNWRLMQRIARWAGVHIVCDQGDMLWMSRRFLGLYAQSEGVHALHFPHPVDVQDAYTGQALGSSITGLELATAKWETRWLLLDPVDAGSA